MTKLIDFGIATEANVKIIDKGTNNILDIRVKPDSGRVQINGSNNRIVVEEFPSEMLKIVIKGDNNTINIGKLRTAHKLSISAKEGATVSIGDLTSIQNLKILAANNDVTIGRDCMISYRVMIRTSDAHGIYSLESGDLVNPPGPIAIGDHVWICQGVVVSKHTVVEKNAVVGACSYLQKIVVPPATIVAGTPARVIREGTIWDRRTTRNIFAKNRRIDTHFLNHLNEAMAPNGRDRPLEPDASTAQLAG